MCSLREDLIFKGLSYTWYQTVKQDVPCSAENVVCAILEEEKLNKFSDCSLNLKDNFSGENLEKLKAPLVKYLKKTAVIEKAFKKMVCETAKGRETGQSVGWILVPFLKKLIPQDLVGGLKNKTALLKNFRRSFLFGKMDSVPVSHLINNLDMKTVLWLKQFKLVRTKLRLLTAMVKWLWRMTKRLVAVCFFVSETQGAPNQLAYIPKRAWQAETDRQFNSLIHCGSLKPLTASEVQRLADLRNPARLRWLPKAQGLRPVISVRGDKTHPETVAAKRLLKILLTRHYKYVTPLRLSQKWRELVKLHRSANQKRELYFVSCDIHDAYGSIIQDKMLQIVEEEINTWHGSGITQSRCLAEMSTIIKAVKYQTLKKLKTSYLLTKGLSAAMPLSSSLCNLYLSHLDRTVLAEFTGKPDEELIRAVDDYIFITPDKTRAKLFLNTMTAGFSDYGLRINPSKTQTNLDGDLEIYFYGYLINSANMEVYVNYSQGISVTFRNSMAFHTTPTSVLEDKLIRIPRQKLNQLTTSRRYMTLEGVARNVFHTGCAMARSLTAILALSLPCEVPESSQLLDLISCQAGAVARRVYKLGTVAAAREDKDNVAKQDIFMCLKKKEVSWIVVRAFHLCLTHAAPMSMNLPEAVVTSLGYLEEAAVKEVRPKIITLLTPIVDRLPPQFRGTN